MVFKKYVGGRRIVSKSSRICRQTKKRGDHSDNPSFNMSRDVSGKQRAGPKDKLTASSASAVRRKPAICNGKLRHRVKRHKKTQSYPKVNRKRMVTILRNDSCTNNEATTSYDMNPRLNDFQNNRSRVNANVLEYTDTRGLPALMTYRNDFSAIVPNICEPD